MKNPGEKDRQLLRDQVYHSKSSHGDSFFRGPSSSAPRRIQDPDVSSSLLDSGGKKVAAGAKRAKKIELDSELPKAYAEMRKAMAGVEEHMKSAIAAAGARKTEMSEEPDADITADRALLAFMRSTQFRTQLAFRWQGAEDIAWWILPSGCSPSPSPGNPGARAPGTPAVTCNPGHPFEAR